MQPIKDVLLNPASIVDNWNLLLPGLNTVSYGVNSPGEQPLLVLEKNLSGSEMQILQLAVGQSTLKSPRRANDSEYPLYGSHMQFVAKLDLRPTVS